jgi:hypothetical protein
VWVKRIFRPAGAGLFVWLFPTAYAPFDRLRAGCWAAFFRRFAAGVVVKSPYKRRIKRAGSAHPSMGKPASYLLCGGLALQCQSLRVGFWYLADISMVSMNNLGCRYLPEWH